MSSCFVPDCKVGRGSNRARLFKPPKTADKSLWLKNLPKRTDCVFDFSKSVICDKHFDPSFIKPQNQSTIIINGEVVPLPVRIQYTLTSDAVPTIFPNLPKYFQKKVPIKRRSVNGLPCIIPLKKPGSTTTTTTTTTSFIPKTSTTTTTTQNDKLNEFNKTASTEIESTETAELMIICKELHQNSEKLPNEWCLSRVDSGKFLILEIVKDVNDIPAIQKYIEVKENKSLTVKISGHVHKDITHHVENIVFSTAQDIVNVVEKVDKLKICEGIDGFEEVSMNSKIAGTLKNGRRYSEFCEVVLSMSCYETKYKMCENCRKILPGLRQLRHKLSKKVAPRKNAIYLDDSMIQIEIQNDDSTVKYVDYK